MAKTTLVTTGGLPLPNFGDAASITAFLTTLVGYALSGLTFAHVTVPAGTTAEVALWAGIAGVAISTAVGLVNYLRVALTHKAAVTAGAIVLRVPNAQLVTYVAPVLAAQTNAKA